MYISAEIKIKAFLRADQNEFTQAQLSSFKNTQLRQGKSGSSIYKNPHSNQNENDSVKIMT